MDRDDWMKVIFSGLIFALIVSLISYGIANRPSIDYKMDCPNSLIYSQSVSPQYITLDFLNEGVIDSPTKIKLNGNNVTLNPEDKSPYVHFNTSSITYYYTLSGGAKVPNYATQTVYIEPNGPVKQFELKMTVQKYLPKRTISTIFAKIFGESMGYYPDSCLYKLNSTTPPVYYLSK